jgi:hypothetical protein
MEVESLANNSPKKKDQRSLLPVLLGIILVVQVCSAYDLEVKSTASPSHVYLGQSVSISTRVYEPGNPGGNMANLPVMVHVRKPDFTYEYLFSTTNASGWAANTYTPGIIGDYGIAGFTKIGTYWYPTPDLLMIRDDFNVTAAPAFIPKVPTQKFVPLGTLTPTPAAQPVTSTATAQQTATGTPATQAPPVTQMTQVIPATPAVMGSQSDTTPPVTTLTLNGTEDGSGGYRSDVICTLAAADNAGGTGVKMTQYSFDGTSWYTYSQPVSVVKAGLTTLYYRSADNAGNLEVAQVKVITISGPAAVPAGTIVPAATATQAGSGSSPPFWLIALIILIIFAVIGGALYWKSRQNEEPKK